MQESLVLILWELILQLEHSESEVPKHVSQEKWHSISIQTELTPSSVLPKVLRQTQFFELIKSL